MKRLLLILISCAVIAWSMTALAADGYGTSVYGTSVYGAAGGAMPKVLISGNNVTCSYVLVNCTDPAYDVAVQVTGTSHISENSTYYKSNGLALDADETCTVTNTILEGNTQDIDVAATKTVTAKNNCLHHSADATTNIGAGTYTDTDSIFTLDPLFRNSATQDFRLKRKSPCRDRGDNTPYSGLINKFDLEGNRITDAIGNVVARYGKVDIGAYEYQKKHPWSGKGPW